MARIVVGTTQPAAEGDVEAIILTIVAEPSDWQGLFDQMQVYRSTSGPSGPFEELTAEAWKVPRLPKDAENPPVPSVTGGLVNVVGLVLQLLVGTGELDITFTGSNPLTKAQAASQIGTQGLGLVTSYVAADGRLVVEGVMPGVLAKLTIVGGDAAPVLGLPIAEPDSVDFGHDPRISLSPDVSRYTFVDYLGNRNNYYRTRFRNRVSGAQSDFSISFTADDGIGVTPENLITGVATLIGIDGKPLVGAEIRIHSEFGGSLVEGSLVTSSDIIKLTDNTGRVSVNLLRGQSVTVAVAGTTLVRTITIPSDPALSTFSLFDPSIAGDDVFRVNVPNLIVAERRSL